MELQTRNGVQTNNGEFWVKCATVLWLLAIAGVSTRVALTRSPKHQDVFPVYHEAGQSWLAGRDLYHSSQFDYRYSPLFAATLAPLSLLPLKVGSILWRLVSVSVLLGALYQATRLGIPALTGAARAGLLFVLLVPLALGNLNNGQANLLVLGLLIVSIVAVCCQRWTLAAVCVTLAGSIKIYPLFFCLPLVLMQPRRLSWRFGLYIAVAIALPFVLQKPDYVSRQYNDWFRYLRTEDRSSRPISEWYSNLKLLFHVWSVPLSSTGFLILQVLSAALIASWAWIGKRLEWANKRLLGWALSLSCCWMVLFGPATESSTYVLIAPATVWIVTGMFHRSRGLLEVGWGVVILGLQLLPEMAAWFGGMKRFHIYTSFLTLAALSVGAYLLRPAVFRELETGQLNPGQRN